MRKRDRASEREKDRERKNGLRSFRVFIFLLLLVSVVVIPLEEVVYLKSEVGRASNFCNLCFFSILKNIMDMDTMNLDGSEKSAEDLCKDIRMTALFRSWKYTLEQIHGFECGWWIPM